MTTDHTALIAEARRAVLAMDHERAYQGGLVDRLADALVQVTAELQQAQADARNSLSRAEDAQPLLDSAHIITQELKGDLFRARHDIDTLTAERDAAYTAIREALAHDPLHGKTWGLHCGGMAPCIRAILSRIPTEGA